MYLFFLCHAVFFIPLNFNFISKNPFSVSDAFKIGFVFFFSFLIIEKHIYSNKFFIVVIIKSVTLRSWADGSKFLIENILFTHSDYKNLFSCIKKNPTLSYFKMSHFCVYLWRKKYFILLLFCQIDKNWIFVSLLVRNEICFSPRRTVFSFFIT